MASGLVWFLPDDGWEQLSCEDVYCKKCGQNTKLADHRQSCYYWLVFYKGPIRNSNSYKCLKKPTILKILLIFLHARSIPSSHNVDKWIEDWLK